MTDDDQLDERKASILRAIVEEYVETAQPVGSQTVARSSGLGVSSATIRNDMTILEREGFIVQPHTSAGRVPTDRGYRFFVDNFTGRGPLPASQHRAVADFFATTHRALEDLLNETSQLLSRVSRHAAMVVGPPPDQAEIRTVQLVRLHERTEGIYGSIRNHAGTRVGGPHTWPEVTAPMPRIRRALRGRPADLSRLKDARCPLSRHGIPRDRRARLDEGAGIGEIVELHPVNASLEESIPRAHVRSPSHCNRYQLRCHSIQVGLRPRVVDCAVRDVHDVERRDHLVRCIWICTVVHVECPPCPHIRRSR